MGREFKVERPIALWRVIGMLFAAVAASSRGGAAEVPWVTMAPGGGSVVRVMADGACPRLSVDGRSRAMNVRAAAVTMPARPSASGSAEAHPSVFPSTVCEAPIARGARRASIGGERVPLARQLIRRIVLVGDTGCRLKAADKAWQACNDPAEWPFAEIAASAARTRPDLVIHVGDYHYRETPCPADKLGCAGSPWGYGEDAWRADLLVPGAPLLAAAAWAVSRGNHEACDRAGQGWRRLLDPHPLVAGSDCIDPANDFAGDHEAPYSVDLGGGAQLIMLDLGSVGAKELAADDPRRPRFAEDARAAAAMTSPATTSFLVGHYPFGAVRVTKKGRTEAGNPALTATFGTSDRVPELPGIAAVLSGHVHQFEQVSFSGAAPSQIVTGFSGTFEDDPAAPGDAASLSPLDGGLRVASLLSIIGPQGFGLLERRTRTHWSLSIRDRNGRQMASCELRGRRSMCIRAP